MNVLMRRIFVFEFSMTMPAMGLLSASLAAWMNLGILTVLSAWKKGNAIGRGASTRGFEYLCIL